MLFPTSKNAVICRAPSTGHPPSTRRMPRPPAERRAPAARRVPSAGCRVPDADELAIFRNLNWVFFDIRCRAELVFFDS